MKTLSLIHKHQSLNSVKIMISIYQQQKEQLIEQGY